MSARIETITWHTPQDEMPDAHETVLCRWQDAAYDVWFGYTDGDAWFAENGRQMPKPIEWAHSPEGSGR